MSKADALGALKKKWGDERIEMILGTEDKNLAPSEAENYKTTNRSIHAIGEIPPGEILTTNNTAILRTEKNLSTGLFPEYWETILGRKTKKRIPSGEGILFDYLED